MIILSMDLPAPLLAFLPLIIFALGFDIYCWLDIAHSNKTKGLPKWIWALIVAVSSPVGGIIYLLVGRGQDDN